MHFCPNCKFMVYTKMNENSNGLINYCKNCGWSGELNNISHSIYNRNYQEDFIADKVISNKYTIFDNTLPRVSYTCVNNNCATNLEFNTSNTFLITNIPADYDDKQTTDIFDEDSDKIKTILRIKLTSCLIEVKDDADKDILKQKYCQKQLEGDRILCVEYVKPKNEVLYIKYDTVNLKYLYICAVCGTSWKKN